MAMAALVWNYQLAAPESNQDVDGVSMGIGRSCRCFGGEVLVGVNFLRLLLKALRGMN